MQEGFREYKEGLENTRRVREYKEGLENTGRV